MDEKAYKKANDQFYQDYLNGELDMMAYLELALKPLSEHPRKRFFRWRSEFVEKKIEPLILQRAEEVIEHHRQAGDFIMIISATNRFVTEPIAERFGVDHLIATDPEIIEGRYTGKVSGIPSFKRKGGAPANMAARTGNSLQGRGSTVTHTTIFLSYPS